MKCIYDMQPLLDATALLITQSRLNTPLEDRQQTLRHLRKLIAQTILDIFQKRIAIDSIRDSLERGLSRVRRDCLSGITAEQIDYAEYCLREIRIAFELAVQVMEEYRNDETVAQIMLRDLPIFRPFDYGVQQISDQTGQL